MALDAAAFDQLGLATSCVSMISESGIARSKKEGWPLLLTRRLRALLMRLPVPSPDTLRVQVMC